MGSEIQSNQGNLGGASINDRHRRLLPHRNVSTVRWQLFTALTLGANNKWVL